MRKSDFLKKCVSLMLAAVMVLALAVPMAESKAATTADNSYDISEYRKDKEIADYTYPSKDGSVFAGWYADADYQTPLGSDVTEGTAYAKFVSADVLKTKYQLPVTASETDTTVSLRLITSVDSINYKSVGFKVEYTDNGVTQTREFKTKNVYSILKGNIDNRVMMNYTSEIFSEESIYLMAMTVNKIPKAVYDSGLTVTPQWVTLDGTTVSGESRNLKEEEATSTPLTAGLYTLDTTPNATKFVEYNGEAEADGSVVMTHKDGPYIVLKGYNFGTNDFTVSTWFKVPKGEVVSTGSGTYLFGTSYPDSASGFSVCLKKDAIRFRVNGTNDMQHITYKQGTWTNMVLSRKGDTLEVYVDGKLASTMTTSGVTDFGTADLAFGGYYGNPNNYHGNKMCYQDIEMYSKAMMQGEIEDVILNLLPNVEVTYTGGAIENTGDNQKLTVGAYKLDTTPNATKFVETTDVSYTTGRDGDAKGALSMKHSTGAYTVVKDYIFGTDDFAISTWFNVPTSSGDVSTGSGTYLFGIDQPDGSNGFAVSLKKDVIRFRVNGANTMPSVTYSKGTWNNVVLSREGDALKLYFNGVLIQTTELTQGYDFATTDLAFGAYIQTTGNYHGNTMYYDDIQVYGRTLSVEEIDERILGNTSVVPDPIVDIDYSGQTIVNKGTNQTLTVGAYKLDQTPNATKFVETTASYTTGMEGDANGALSMKHNAGAYTVVKDYNFGTDDFTISAWVNIPTNSGDAAGGAGTYLFGIDQPEGADGFSVSLKPSVIRFRAESSTVMPSVTYSKGTWNNVVLCREGDSLNLYFNGTLLHTASLTAGHDFKTADLSFGAYINTAANYHGNTMYYDNIKIYGEALEADFISYAAQAGEHMVTWAAQGRNNKTTLFVGDSFFCSKYWTNFYETYAGKDAIRAGIGGSTTYDWDVLADDFLAKTEPKNLVVHLGTNDIHVDKNNATTAINNLQALFTKIHELENYKDTKIYYMQIPYKRDVSSTHTNTVDAVNAAMKTWCGERDWITYVEYFSRDVFTTDKFYDHTHITVDAYQYIVDALNKTDLVIELLPTEESTSSADVAITYTGGVIKNTGSDSTLTVGAYKLDTTPNATAFVGTTDVSYVAGIDGDANGAISMKHNTGAYTVVKNYNFGTDDFTISTWFNVPTNSANVSTGSGTYVFGIDQPDGSNGFAVSMKSGNIRLRLNGSTYQPSVSYSKGTWNNLVLRREGDTITLYFNGDLKQTQSITAGYDYGTVDLSFGAYINCPNNYHGSTMYYDNIEVYGSALVENDIRYAGQAGQHRAAWATQGNDGATTLFIGDSFFSSRAYWTDFYTTYEGKDAYCAGISSTTTYDWNTFADTYLKYTSPKNLVVHLGTNDVHVDKDDAATVTANLQNLFTKIHTMDSYKDTKIYYFGIPYKKSTMYQDVNASAEYSATFKTTINTVNKAMEEWCSGKDWITYMGDLTGGAIADTDFRDNTHLSLEKYSLITDALGKTDIVIGDQ